MDFVTGTPAVGQPLSRTEDPRLLRGEGRYTNDINLPNQAHAYILRSAHAHGIIRNIERDAALAMPGVLAIYTGADLQAAGYGTLPCNVALKSHDGTPLLAPENPALAIDRVRYRGHPVAAVIANAVSDAIGAPIDSIPITPEAVLDALQSLEHGVSG